MARADADPMKVPAFFFVISEQPLSTIRKRTKNNLARCFFKKKTIGKVGQNRYATALARHSRDYK
jgi:hypothetical protein